MSLYLDPNYKPPSAAQYAASFDTPELAIFRKQVLVHLDNCGFFLDTAKELQSFQVPVPRLEDHQRSGESPNLNFTVTVLQQPEKSFLITRSFQPKGKTFVPDKCFDPFVLNRQNGITLGGKGPGLWTNYYKAVLEMILLMPLVPIPRPIKGKKVAEKKTASASFGSHQNKPHMTGLEETLANYLRHRVRPDHLRSDIANDDNTSPYAVDHRLNLNATSESKNRDQVETLVLALVDFLAVYKGDPEEVFTINPFFQKGDAPPAACNPVVFTRKQLIEIAKFSR